MPPKARTTNAHSTLAVACCGHRPQAPCCRIKLHGADIGGLFRRFMLQAPMLTTKMCGLFRSPLLAGTTLPVCGRARPWRIILIAFCLLLSPKHLMRPIDNLF